jgi:low affinity Fe/Cu permease
VVVAWAVTGPLFRFSDTWQLVINTGTTIVTFLMVFLILYFPAGCICHAARLSSLSAMA